MDPTPHRSTQAPADPAASGGLTAVRIIVRTALAATTIACFAGLAFGALWLLYNGHPWLAATSATLILMVAPLLARGETWRARITVTASAPFFVLGGVGGFFVYLRMFSFPWFDAVFNNKGGGPLGLFLFVVAFAVGAGFLAGAIFSRVFRSGT